MTPDLEHSAEIWLTDFEHAPPSGDPPAPVCSTGLELHSGRLERRWLWGESPGRCPFGTGPNALYASWSLPAELVCHEVLGWPRPRHAIDLCVEYHRYINGTGGGWGLLDALQRFHFDLGPFVAKDEMQRLAARG